MVSQCELCGGDVYIQEVHNSSCIALMSERLRKLGVPTEICEKKTYDELLEIEKEFLIRANRHGELKKLADDIIFLKEMRWI